MDGTLFLIRGGRKNIFLGRNHTVNTPISCVFVWKIHAVECWYPAILFDNLSQRALLLGHDSGAKTPFCLCFFEVV